MTTLTIPRSFFDDHQERDLATPSVIASGSYGYRIDADDRALPNLICDAQFYAEDDGPTGWYSRAAKALLASLAKQGVAV